MSYDIDPFSGQLVEQQAPDEAFALIRALRAMRARALWLGDKSATPALWTDRIAGATSTQADATKQPSLVTVAGRQFLTFDAVNDGMLTNFTLDATLDGYTMILVESPNTAGGTYRTVQSLASNCIMSVSRSGANQVYFQGALVSQAEPLATDGTHILSLSLKPDQTVLADSMVVRFDGVDITAGTPGGFAWGQIAFGSSGLSGDPAATRGGALAIVPYFETDRALLALAEYYGVTLSDTALPVLTNPRQRVFVGDSITNGTGATVGTGTAETTDTNYPGRTMAALADGSTGVNMSVPAVQASAILNGTAGEAYRIQYDPAADGNDLLILAGTNDDWYDVSGDSNATIAGRIFATLQNLYASGVSVGYNKVRLGTLLGTTHAGAPAHFNAVRNLVNTSIRAAYPASVIMDFAADSRIGTDAAPDGANFYDKLHLNDAGYAIMGQIAADSLI